MSRNTVVLHSALAPEAVADALLRSIDIEAVLYTAMPWFIRLVWSGGSHPIYGVVEGNTFRLTRENASRFAPKLLRQMGGGLRWNPNRGAFRLSPLGQASDSLYARSNAGYGFRRNRAKPA